MFSSVIDVPGQQGRAYSLPSSRLSLSRLYHNWTCVQLIVGSHIHSQHFENTKIEHTLLAKFENNSYFLITLRICCCLLKKDHGDWCKNKCINSAATIQKLLELQTAKNCDKYLENKWRKPIPTTGVAFCMPLNVLRRIVWIVLHIKPVPYKWTFWILCDTKSPTANHLKSVSCYQHITFQCVVQHVKSTVGSLLNSFRIINQIYL